MRTNRPTGMLAFVVVIIGQIVSLIGSNMTMFAISIWAWEMTGQATALSLVAFFGFGPMILLSPVAGALVDRWNRKLVMMLSDLAAGLSTVVLLLLLVSDQLEIWHLYIANAFVGAFQALQFPAYSAAVTLMMPKQHYTRANGLISLTGPAANIFGPILAAALIGYIGVSGIMFIDIITFVVAVGALFFVFIPQPEPSTEGLAGKGTLLQESLYGFRYIFQRLPLLGLLMVFSVVNFTYMFSSVLLTPMILARTGNDELLLGSVMSIGSVGGLVGALTLSAWGGPKRRIHGVLLGMIGVGFFSQVLIGWGFGVLVWGFSYFVGSFCIPIIQSSSQAIWQTKVAPDVQGRVFASRRLIGQIGIPLAMLLAGPLADRVFEPAMQPGGALATLFSGFVGAGAGNGMAVIFILFGLLTMVIGFGGYFFPSIRDVEQLIPDHDVAFDELAVPQPGNIDPETPSAKQAERHKENERGWISG